MEIIGQTRDDYHNQLMKCQPEEATILARLGTVLGQSKVFVIKMHYSPKLFSVLFMYKSKGDSYTAVRVFDDFDEAMRIAMETVVMVGDKALSVEVISDRELLQDKTKLN